MFWRESRLIVGTVSRLLQTHPFLRSSHYSWKAAIQTVLAQKIDMHKDNDDDDEWLMILIIAKIYKYIRLHIIVIVRWNDSFYNKF